MAGVKETGVTMIAWGAKDLNISAQLVLAKRLKFFEQFGLTVQCKLFPTEQQLTEAFAQGPERPFVWTQTVPDILRLRARGHAVKIIAPLADISASYQVIVHEDAGIILPGELEERKIGIVRGSLIEVAFRNMARDFGVEVANIHFIDASPMKQLELFVERQIDALACWEPWTSQAQYVGGKLYFSGLYSQIPGHEGSVNWLTGQSMLATFEETIRTAAEPLIMVLRGLKKATDYLNATTHKAASVLSDLLGVKNEELVVLLQKNLYSMTMDDLFNVGLASIQDMFVRMESPGRLEQESYSRLVTLPITELYVSDLLKQVHPSLVQIADDHPSSKKVEIITEDNIYYPVASQIQHVEGTPLRYLIVDDTRVVTELFSEIVEMMNGTVVGTAATGSEAMLRYIELLPDIVVMDISMPDISGIEAIKRIFAINPAANIIVLSGNNYADIRQAVFDLGVKGFIGKPFHVDEVARVLSKLLP